MWLRIVEVGGLYYVRSTSPGGDVITPRLLTQLELVFFLSEL